ncbi:hypothetical protein BFJ70_g16632 [Fusarium oxysporum]|nr:hypothetical protein BFJ70_g16632 [Fusarium oxysporum]
MFSHLNLLKNNERCLQLDGVKRGTLADRPRERFPHPGSAIAVNFLSPIDAIYLAAIFDPIFTISYPNTRKVQRASLLGAVLAALSPVIAVFPECGTTNGKAILPFSPSILQTLADVHIFPVSIRYTPSDITTPVPGKWFRFLWDLLSRPTTCIRVRIAEGQMNTSTAKTNGVTPSSSELRNRSDTNSGVSLDEQRVIDRIGEALAGLSRVKRVGLTMKDKAAFVDALHGKKQKLMED